MSDEASAGSHVQPAVPPSAGVSVQRQHPPESKEVDLLVTGAVANDSICDYDPRNQAASIDPILKTSNPAKITQSIGGVGRNVATAASYAGVKVGLATAVADDIAGTALMERLKSDGLDTQNVRTLKTTNGASTPSYVAVNDLNKDLVLAMADMSILTRPELESKVYWQDCLASSKPKWVVADANWSPAILASILGAAKSHNIPTAFEPVSTAKAVRLFNSTSPAITANDTLPDHVLNLAAPNAMELTAMYMAAREQRYFDSDVWWKAVDSFGLSDSGSREKLTSVTNLALVEQGIPQQALQLLPYIPNLVIKLGPDGCLVVQVLQSNDPRLRSPDSAQYVIGRSFNGDASVGGVYMRLFPASEQVKQTDIVSVNGIGDTMLGVIMACLVKGWTLEQAIPVSQKAAVLSLKSAEAVSPNIREMQSLIQARVKA
jgi:pseudouridylate synthase / pseudouridine kinase